MKRKRNTKENQRVGRLVTRMSHPKVPFLMDHQKRPLGPVSTSTSLSRTESGVPYLHWARKRSISMKWSVDASQPCCGNLGAEDLAKMPSTICRMENRFSRLLIYLMNIVIWKTIERRSSTSVDLKKHCEMHTINYSTTSVPWVKCSPINQFTHLAPYTSGTTSTKSQGHEPEFISRRLDLDTPSLTDFRSYHRWRYAAIVVTLSLVCNGPVQLILNVQSCNYPGTRTIARIFSRKCLVYCHTLRWCP